MLKHSPGPQAFANWRIPKRLSGEVEEAKIGDHVGLVVPEKAPTPKLLRQSTLPALPSSRDAGKVFTPKPRLSPAAAARQSLPPSSSKRLLHRSKTMFDQPATITPLDPGIKLKSRAGQWQQRLPDVDPRLLHKVLRMQDKAGGAGPPPALRGTVMPDARRTVERWLETASEPERQVALQFFGSLAGGRLMGDGGNEQSARLKDVVQALQSPGNRWVAEGGLSPRGGAFARGEQDLDGPKRLKYIQLLDEDTRRQRWMHTTWHHLPNYHQFDRVNNWSSHYVQPHKAQHRHFVIHPDWPPE